MACGTVAGVLFGRASIRMLNRVRLEYRGLYPVLTIALVALAYGATALLGGNGFLAVYLMGITMGRHNFVQRRTLTRFHDGIAWLMQIAMFITLGLLVFPRQLLPVAGISVAIAAFLMFVARPAAVFVSLAASSLAFREKLLVSWVGLRGAVPIILATFPLVARVPAAPLIFNVVFFIVFASVLLQGTTIALVARWLRLDSDSVEDFSPAVAHLAGRGESALFTVAVHPESPAVGRRVVELPWPRDALIVVIYRGNEFFAPNGATVIEAADRLVVLTSKASAEAVRDAVELPALAPRTV
jgi:cell volume regulation protein A